MDRRLFLLAMLGLAAGVSLPGGHALAKDGGDSDSGGGDDGGDSHDSDNSGSGSSGHGSDDKDDDHDDDGDHSGHGRGGNDDQRRGRGSGKNDDHQKAREAVNQGRILPLREILKRVEDNGGGRVISVDLNLKARAPYYTLKVQSGSRVRTMKLEAATGRKLNIFGW